MADVYKAALDELVRWLTALRKRIQSQVTVKVKGKGSEEKTTVRIDHRIPCDLDAYSGWHVETATTFLPREHFTSQVRAYVKTAAAIRGRAVYCVDNDIDEVVAAMAYHIDRNTGFPVLITTLGYRIDLAGNPSLQFRTLAGALVLKHHAHAIAEKTGRGGHIDLDLADKKELQHAKDLGFRNAPKVKDMPIGGTHLRQAAPVKT